jgi:hypothetical protein
MPVSEFIGNDIVIPPFLNLKGQTIESPLCCLA